MSLSYVDQVFGEAVRALATSAKPIQKRMSAAFAALRKLEVDEVPQGDQMRERFAQLRSRLSESNDPENETMNLPDDEAVKLAESICGLEYLAREYYFDERRKRGRRPRTVAGRKRKKP